jgi:hypothetical protein
LHGPRRGDYQRPEAPPRLIGSFGTPVTTRPEWRRVYDEINAFERMLLEDNARLVKIFLHVTPKEQIHRFRARLTDPLNAAKWSRRAVPVVASIIAPPLSCRLPSIINPAKGETDSPDCPAENLKAAAFAAISPALSSGECQP